MKTIALWALAFGMAAAPMSSAQTPPPEAPPTIEAPPAPTTVAPPAPTTEAPPAPSASTNERSCRTRKEVGEACACLSAPEQVGVVEAASDGGRNMCVVSALSPAQ